MAFTVDNTLDGLIMLPKDRLPKMHRLGVVYKINCNNCEASYVGQTSRRLATRIKEHQFDINKRSDILFLHVSTHRFTSHDFDWENFLILDEEPSLMRSLPKRD